MADAVLKALKWLLAGLLAIVILAALAVELMSWNFLKPMISERIETATGRSLTIDGDVTLSLLPRPEASVDKVTLGNPEWSSGARMLEVERISVSPDLSSLALGHLVLSEIRIEAPVLSLENRADKPGNWAFPELASDEDPTEPEQDPAPPLLVRHLSVSDATINYLAAGADAPEVLSIPSLELSDDSETLRAQANLSFSDRNFRLEANTDSLYGLISGKRALQGKASVASGDSSIKTTFDLQELPALDELQADVKIRARDMPAWSRWLKMPEFDLDSVDLAAALVRDGSRWQLNDIEIALLDSLIKGNLSLSMAGENPVIEGKLQSHDFDADALIAALPAAAEKTRAISIPVLPRVRGDIEIAIDRLILQQRTFEDLETVLGLAPHSASLEPFRLSFAGSEVEGTASLSSDPDGFSTRTEISFQDLNVEQLDLALTPGDRLSGNIAISLDRLQRTARVVPETLLANLKIDRADISYVNESAGNDLDLALELSGQPPTPILSLEGRFQNKPINLSLEGDPLPDLITRTNAYRLQDQATSGQLRAWVNTSLGSVLKPETLAGDIALNGADGRDLEKWLNIDLPPLPDFRLTGRLNRSGNRWSATGLEGRIATTNLTGSLDFHNTGRPVIELELQTDRIDLDQLIVDTESSGGTPESNGRAGNGGDSPLAALRGFNGQIDLSTGTLILPDGLELRDFLVSASLKAGNVRLDPLQFTIADGSVNGSLGLNASSKPASGRIDAEFDSIALSNLGDTFTPLEERLGILSGELHLDITETLASDRRDDLLLPFIGRVRFDASRLEFVDKKAQTDMTVSIETTGLDDNSQAFHLDGEGLYNGSPFSLRFRGDPLLDARDPDQPWALDMEATIVESQLSLKGSILRPFTLKGLNLDLALSGPNPQKLSRLTGIPLPVLPPYSVSGNLELEDDHWAFTDLQGDVGDSDLGGQMALDVNTLPPRLTAELESDSLDLADLGLLVGADGETEGQTAATSGEDAQLPDDRFILPDRPLVTDAWNKLRADIRYRGKSVRAGDIPLSDVVIDFALQDGRGRFQPVTFGVGDGDVDFNLDMNARQQPPSGTAQLEVQGVDLQKALGEWNLADDSVGIIGARGKYWVEGATIAKMLASGDGGMVLLMTDGRLDSLLVELAGLDASQTLLSWVTARDAIPINCSYLDLQTRDGIANIDTLVIDTDDTSFTGGGQIDFNTERLGVTMYAHPKDPSILTVRSPLHLTGTFNQIEPSIHGENLAARVALSTALAAAGGPAAALLPLLEVGAGDDIEYCKGLVSRSREAMEQRSTGE
jgi:uncharacterized protein involved in outer membrane biogenesis